MKSFQIKNMLFYSADELKTSFPNFFIGTSKTVRLIINKKNIPITDYIYANKIKNDEWNISDASSKKAKLLLTKSWVEQHLIREKGVETILEEEKEYKIAPNKIELEDHEKFRDVNGKVIEIETLGERHHEKIYFCVHDISVGFDMPNLNRSLLHKESSGYEKGIHYELFIRNELLIKQLVPNINGQQDKNTRKLYLTYGGLTRFLFVSRNQNAEHFQKWAIEKLFTIQMGTKLEKERLGTNLLQINLDSFRAVFKKHANKFPSIYLLVLGTVAELRETFNISPEIDDKLIVYKYGFTDDFPRRIKEHQDDYGKLPNVNISVAVFHIIDTKYTSDAEDDLRQFFKNMNKTLEIEGRKELVFLNSKELETVKKEFRHIGNDYAGNTQELQKQIQDLNIKLEKQELQHKLEMQELQHKIKDIQQTHEIELLKKEMIIQQQKSKIEYNELCRERPLLSVNNISKSPYIHPRNF